MDRVDQRHRILFIGKYFNQYRKYHIMKIFKKDNEEAN